MPTVQLSARPPFRFSSVVQSHGWLQLAPFHYDETAGVLSYIDRLAGGRIVEYRISEAAKGVKAEMEGRFDPSELQEIAERITWMLSLELDFTAFYKAARKEPKLDQARKLARGRMLRSSTLFEDVVKTILTTNTVWGATRRMNQNLITALGEPLPDSERKSFPSPGAIAASSEKYLRQTVRVGYRAPAIHELAVRVAKGEFDLESFRTSGLPTPELRKALMAIRGVGPYAAATLLMILGRPDFIPIDSWALKLVSHEWYRGRPVTARQVEKRFEKWGEYKGLAYWFWDWKYSGG